MRTLSGFGWPAAGSWLLDLGHTSRLSITSSIMSGLPKTNLSSEITITMCSNSHGLLTLTIVDSLHAKYVEFRYIQWNFTPMSKFLFQTLKSTDTLHWGNGSAMDQQNTWLVCTFTFPASVVIRSKIFPPRTLLSQELHLWNLRIHWKDTCTPYRTLLTCCFSSYPESKVHNLTRLPCWHANSLQVTFTPPENIVTIYFQTGRCNKKFERHTVFTLNATYFSWVFVWTSIVCPRANDMRNFPSR